MIFVQAEHSYEVTFTKSWAIDLVKRCEGRTRVAVIVSKSFAPDLSTLKNLDSELHVCEVPDGEEGHPSREDIRLAWVVSFVAPELGRRVERANRGVVQRRTTL